MGAVVLGEVTGLGDRLAVEATCHLLDDVVVQPARRMTHGENALDGGSFRDSEAQGMSESRIEVLGGVAFPEQQDAPCLMAPATGRSG